MSQERPKWYDDAAGPLVRPYAVTRGRTRAVAADLNLITQVLAVDPHADARQLAPECAQILAFCDQPLSIAEIGARLSLPIAVTKILVSDLLDRQLVVTQSSTWRPDVPDRDMLQAVINGLRGI